MGRIGTTVNGGDQKPAVDDVPSAKRKYLDECAKYFPPELVGSCGNQSEMIFYCYLIELESGFEYDVELQDILLAVHTRLDDDEVKIWNLDLDVDRGKLNVRIKHVGCATLNSEQVARCRRFQITLFSVLLGSKSDNIPEELGQYSERDGSFVFNYLLLPFVGRHPNISVDWKCIAAVLYQDEVFRREHTDFCSIGDSRHRVYTSNGSVCSCMLENSLVSTPHNDSLYCITGFLDGIDGNASLKLRGGQSITYKKHFEQRHGIKLRFERETLLKGRCIFTVKNYLQKCRIPSAKGAKSGYTSYELPPELCLIIMSPISLSTFYSFSFLPSVMHRFESLLIASNLKSMHTDHYMQNVVIPTPKVLEAITTKECQESFHLKSLATLGDSFLKYAVSQQIFKTFQNLPVGLLSNERERIISNVALCKLGCELKITGFIRNEQFEPKKWIIPGTNCANHILGEEMLSSKKVYIGRNRRMKRKRVADAVEALLGAFLITGGEMAALFFMAWLGVNIDFVCVPHTRNFAADPELHVNIRYLESLLNYSFNDASLLAEALTHCSYKRPEIRGCYQRLEFLGDAVLDYLITYHYYFKYNDSSSGLLTDLRSQSVNNDGYAQSTIKAGLYEHLLRKSPELDQQIVHCVQNFEELSLESTFGWESETTFPKVLADIIESLAGAIYVDSSYNKERVFQSMKPLLEPFVTLETMRLNPVRELNELCQKEHYIIKKSVDSRQNNATIFMVEVEAGGVVYGEKCAAANKKVAKRLAYRAVLRSLKEIM